MSLNTWQANELLIDFCFFKERSNPQFHPSSLFEGLGGQLYYMRSLQIVFKTSITFCYRLENFNHKRIKHNHQWGVPTKLGSLGQKPKAHDPCEDLWGTPINWKLSTMANELSNTSYGTKTFQNTLMGNTRGLIVIFLQTYAPRVYH